MNAAAIQRALIAPLAVTLGLGAAACGDDDGGGGGAECRAALLPGDVVISEVMANPIGQGEGKEWFEIYNTTSEPIDLEGAVLVSGSDVGSGTGASRHVMDSLVIEPGAYAVLGDVLPEFIQEYHDYGYGGDLGSLTNSGGDLAIECAGDVVDSVTYPGMDAGVAMGLDGAIVPDHISNSEPENWCEAEYVFDGDGSRGTPGKPNDSCGAVLESCNDGGTRRDLITPEEGDLVISEVMARPAEGIESQDGEWFEIYVANDVDLNGLQLGQYRHQEHDSPGPQPVGHTLGDADCLHYEAGSSVLFARSADPELNGGLPEVDFTFSLGRFGLTNTNGGVYVGFQGEILDRVTWESPWSTERRRGVSLSLDPRRLTPDQSSDLDNWCYSGDQFSADGVGTPGLSNPSCFAGGPCADESGAIRDIILPQPGDLVISEVFANTPDGISFRDGEWFEIHVASDVDLNTLQLGQYDPSDDDDPVQGVEHTVVRRDCQHYTAGSHVVFARSDEPAIISGIPTFDYVFSGFGLPQSNGGIFLTVGDDLEDLLESVSWTSFGHKGISLSLDPDEHTPDGSSDGDNWCRADQTVLGDALAPYFACALEEDEDENAFCVEVIEDDPDCDDPDVTCSFGTPAEDNPSCDG